MKTLFFEGAGVSEADISRATIGNCRIRTAFHLDDGQHVYLELHGTERVKKSPASLYLWQYTGFVLDCFEITDDVPNDDANRHRFPPSMLPRSYEYSEPAILELVNSLGASFDAVKVVPDFGGYRVFKYPSFSGIKGKKAYNYGDEFQFDAELTARRAAKVAEMEEINKARFGMKYDNTSYYLEGESLIMRLNVSKEKLAAAGLTERRFVLEV